MCSERYIQNGIFGNGIFGIWVLAGISSYKLLVNSPNIKFLHKNCVFIDVAIASLLGNEYINMVL
jgi:hypothetical protein